MKYLFATVAVLALPGWC